LTASLKRARRWARRSLYNETRGEGIYPTPVLGIVGILDDVTKAVPAAFQRAGDAIVLLWPIPRGEQPDPALEVPLNPPPISQYPLPALEGESLPQEIADATEAETAANLTAFGSAEFARVVLHAMWGRPPGLDLDAEADLHTLLQALSYGRLIRSACDISDGGIAVALAQAAFPASIGVTVEQDPSLLAHPLFGLFAEPPSTILLSTAHENISKIEKLAGEHNFLAARIGTTGGNKLRINVDGEPLIDVSLDELRDEWSSALEASLHDEVRA
jgi:phosphoribosylformylglycinamidine synthase subunit PurL